MTRFSVGNDIRIRRLQDEDLPAVLGLLQLALGESELLARTEEWFAWKHRDNPFGPSITLLADSGGQIVGLRAFMRWQLCLPGGDVLSCVRAVDTATHPDHQRRGIFKRLTLEALEVAEGEGVDLVFNTPNPQSKAGYLTMGWSEVGAIKALVRPHPLRLGRRHDGEDLPEPADFISGGVSDCDGLGDRPPLGLRTRRTPEYYRWRFGGHPTARYLRVDAEDGTAIVRPNYRAGRRELIISELQGGSQRKAVRRVIRNSRAGYEVAWFSAGAPERRAAISAGMVPVPWLTALTLVARPLRPLPVDVTRMSSWDLGLSDLELL